MSDEIRTVEEIKAKRDEVIELRRNCSFSMINYYTCMEKTLNWVLREENEGDMP